MKITTLGKIRTIRRGREAAQQERSGSFGRPPRGSRLMLAGGLPLANAALPNDGWAWQSSPHMHIHTLSGQWGLLIAALIIAVPCALLLRRRTRRSDRTAQ